MTQQFVVTTSKVNINSYVLGFQEIDKTRLTLVGGKGANLGELSRIAGIQVPAGFCVTTQAFKRIIKQTPGLDHLLDQLSTLKVDRRKRHSGGNRGTNYVFPFNPG
jgi:phosphoenolpyruvate synthase/pyruvate phosphate dikinase